MGFSPLAFVHAVIAAIVARYQGKPDGTGVERISQKAENCAAIGSAAYEEIAKSIRIVRWTSASAREQSILRKVAFLVSPS